MSKVGLFKKGKGQFGGVSIPISQEDIFLFDGSASTGTTTVNKTETLKDGIVSGNGIAWVINFDYEVTPYVFNINNNQYSTSRNLITLDPSDPTLNRIDVIVATYDSFGNGIIQVLKGENAASPVKPIVSTTQLEITSINVNANTDQSSVTVIDVYDENIEFAGTDNTTGRVDFADVVKKFNGTKSIKVTGFTSGDEIYLIGASFNPINFNVLQFQISSALKWGYNGEIELAIYDGANKISDWVKVDGDPYNSKRNDIFFESGNTSWQTIVIPMERFNVTSSTATKLVFRKVSLGTDTFNIDLIRFQGGLSTPIIISGQTIFIEDGNFLVFKRNGNKNNFALEIGDLLMGIWNDSDEFWNLARYDGGDTTVKASYTVFNPLELT